MWLPGSPWTKEARVFAQTYHRTFSMHRLTYPAALEAAVASAMPPNLNSFLHNIVHGNVCSIRADYRGALYRLAVPYCWEDPPAPSQVIKHSLQVAQVLFTRFDSPAPTEERSLTGSFRARVSQGLSLVNASNRKLFSPWERIHIWAVDLSLKGRETRLGADIAFVFETEDPHSPDTTDTVVFATCLQAKRANPTVNADGTALFDIRRYKTRTNTGAPVPTARDDGYGQLRALQATDGRGIPCGYLFYNNDDQAHLATPHMPLVKPVSKIEGNIATQHRTDIGVHSTDMASYFACLFANVNTIGIPGGDAPRLARLVDDLTTSMPEHLVAVSASADFGSRLKVALSMAERIKSVREIDMAALDIAEDADLDDRDFDEPEYPAPRPRG
jgi:hypothetical protein